MVTAALLINLAILIPVCGGLIVGARWAAEAYGERSPARGILLSVYAAIAVVSAGLLWRPDAGAVAALLALQVIYKVTTPFTVGRLRHPVVITNLAVAAFHAATLATLAPR